MAGELQAYLGRFDIDALSQSITLLLSTGTPAGNQLVSLDTGEYYMAGYTGEATNQLCEEIQQKIRALGNDYSAVTCTLDFATGKITLGNFGFVASPVYPAM